MCGKQIVYSILRILLNFVLNNHVFVVKKEIGINIPSLV